MMNDLQLDSIEEGRKRDMERILSCRYPTVVPQGDPVEFFEWWQDEAGEALAEALEEVTGRLDEDRPATFSAVDNAWSELGNHAEKVVSDTIEALQKGGTVEDLCNLVDGASRAGSAATAFYSDPDSASLFLCKLAELALKQIRNENARPAGTGPSAKQGELVETDANTEGTDHA